VSPYAELATAAGDLVDWYVLTLYHANAIIPIIATPPTTEPATIPAMGVEVDEGAGAEDVLDVGTIEELVDYAINDKPYKRA
jgi:hypothetical protein